MTTLDTDLTHLREQLRNATADDLRRRTRRGRISRFALVPALVLTGAGGAVALAPWQGAPAPPEVQRTFDADRALPGGTSPGLPGSGAQLVAVARGDGHTLYAARSRGGWCLTVDTGAAAGPATTGYNCQPRSVPEQGEIWFANLGGGSDGADNVVSGRVRGLAQTVTVRLRNNDTVVAHVGRGGFFVAALPDTVLNSDDPPVVSGKARNRVGAVVAQTHLPDASQ
jgi:hypothetical protein